ncbi:MAG: hypothetical protein Q9166_002613 [cf. Caloplaca sp. 2 TL-2023]
MPLVAYSDSGNSSEDDDSKQNTSSNTAKPKNLKRTRTSEDELQSDLPPLPDSFHDLYTSTARVSNQDDPSLHAGRQRQIPHVEGQWPTHVYIESDGLRWVANFEHNRWFLVIHVKKPPGDELNKLLKASNKLAHKYGQPALYVPHKVPTAPVTLRRKHQSAKKNHGSTATSPRVEPGVVGRPLEQDDDMSAHFHISIGWTLEKPSDSSIHGLKLNIQLAIDVVKTKIGNGVVVIPLASKHVETNGLVGL